MANTKVKVINKFWGGNVNHDKSKMTGASSNVEEVDIYENEDYIRAAQILSDDSMPASTEVYSYTAGSDDAVYGYGKETSGNKVRIVSVASGGSDNPGSFSTLFTSADSTNLAYYPSPVAFFKTSETDEGYIYYLTNNSGTINLKRYDINGDSESTVGELTGLDGSFDKVSFRIIYGELYVTNGPYIARVDKDGVFTEQSFTMPNNWEAVDIAPVGDVGLILARNINRLENYSRGYWWDLTSASQFDDHFNIPKGGPQWIENHKETVKILCAQNLEARLYQLSGPYPGAVIRELPGIKISNISAETSTQTISGQRMVATKDNILYFGLWKSDKNGVYAIGKLDSDKNEALSLAKRFDTSDYSNHTPSSLLIQGPNFYAAYDDNGTASNSRCETNNSPDRSSNAVYESIWIDDGDPTTFKTYKKVFVTTYPLTSNLSIAASIAKDYASSYTSISRADGSDFNTAGQDIGVFDSKSNKGKVHKLKIAFTSSGTTSVRVTGIGYIVEEADIPGFK